MRAWIGLAVFAVAVFAAASMHPAAAQVLHADLFVFGQKMANGKWIGFDAERDGRTTDSCYVAGRDDNFCTLENLSDGSHLVTVSLHDSRTNVSGTFNFIASDAADFSDEGKPSKAWCVMVTPAAVVAMNKSQCIAALATRES